MNDAALPIRSGDAFERAATQLFASRDLRARPDLLAAARAPDAPASAAFAVLAVLGGGRDETDAAYARSRQTPAIATLAVFRALWGNGDSRRVLEHAHACAAATSSATAIAVAQAHRFARGGDSALVDACAPSAGASSALLGKAVVVDPASEAAGDYDRWWLAVCALASALDRNDSTAAGVQARAIERLAQAIALPTCEAWGAFAGALADVAAQDRRAALGALAAVRRIAGAHEIRTLSIAAAALLGVMASRRGRTMRAARLAAIVREQLAAAGLARLPLLPDPWLDALLALPPPTLTTAAPRVVVRTLGLFEIRLEGERLEWTRKAPRRPLELLKALIALGGREVAVRRLIGAVWSEDEAGDERAFTMALHRLRKLIGDDTVKLGDGRVSLDAQTVRVDALDFAQSGHLALYAGEFLPGEDAAWALPARERLRERHRSIAAAAARSAIDRGAWHEALVSCRAALERDPLAEEIAQLALHACIGGGFRAEASAIYENCRRALADELGLRPAARTESLLREALRD